MGGEEPSPLLSCASQFILHSIVHLSLPPSLRFFTTLPITSSAAGHLVVKLCIITLIITVVDLEVKLSQHTDVGMIGHVNGDEKCRGYEGNRWEVGR